MSEFRYPHLRPECDLRLFSSVALCLAALEERGSPLKWELTIPGLLLRRVLNIAVSTPSLGLQACPAMPDHIRGNQGLELGSTRLRNKQSLPQDFLLYPDVVLLNTGVLS